MIEVGMGRYLLLGWVLVSAVLLAWVIATQGDADADARPTGAAAPSVPAVDGARSEASRTPAAESDAEAVPVQEPPSGVTSFDSEHLALRSNFLCRLDLLARVAEDACARAHALTDLPVPDGPLPIHLCDSEEAVGVVAEEHGVPPCVGRFAGMFHRKGPLVIVENGPSLPQTICHEVVHWIIWASSPGCPPVVDEGLAELVAEETILAAGPEVANLALRVEGLPPMPWSVGNRARRLSDHLRGAPARTLANLSSLESFWGLEHSTYNELRYSYDLHRALAWCLMRVWIREGDSIGMPLKNLFRIVHGSQPSLRGLLRDDAAYERLEAAWKRQVAATANGYLSRR
jgi:hypothetical protein